MNNVLDFLKEHKYLMVALVLVGISILLSVTFSSYIVTSNNHKAAEMYIGELKYSIEINGSTTNTLSVPTGETIIDIKVNNLNPVDTYYKLLYLKNTSITIKYYESTKDTYNVVTTYNKPNDSITSSNSNTIKLLITNNSASSQNIALTMKGGYITNTIQDIITPSTYSEITLVETPSTNTYFCTTTNTLTQGLKYVNGQYTYAYKQEGKNSSSLSWRNITTDGWGVQLTDRTSTDAVTSSLCTYINNKPISSMSNMFVYSQATSINLSNFNTSKVTNMSAMFYKSQATTLDLSSFDTSNVTLMDFMFAYSQATTLDASKLNTSIVKNMSYMFIDSQATTLDLSNFDTSNVTNMYSMFEGSQATTLDVSNFDTSKVTDMGWMFKGNKSTTVDVSKFDTSNVTNMSNMFSNSQATTLDVSNFNTSNVTNMSDMFSNSQATTLDVSNFNTSKVTNMSYMFWNSKSTMLDVSNFNTSNVTNMSYMFYYSQATTLDVSNFNTSKVTNMSYMFWNSKSTMLDVSNFNTSNVTNMSYMFSGSKATTLDLNNFDTSKVTNMSYMFSSSTNLKTIYVSNKFNTDKVTSSTYMFYGCTKLIGGAGTKYNSSYIDKTYAHIDGGTSSPGYFTSIPEPNSFSSDSWMTIAKAVKSGNISKYNVGNTKTVNLGTYGTHILRIANMSTPSECSTTGFSQTACGFVLEFADIITTHKMNDTQTNVGGWPATSMRTFVNNDIYNSLPSELKNAIIDTTVVSSHGSGDTSNFTSTDKLYLLAPKEIYTDFSDSYDTAKDLTRILDYYKNVGVTNNNYSGAIKKKGTDNYFWWLRAAYYTRDYSTFYNIHHVGAWNSSILASNSNGGVSPAFRLG